MIILQSSQGITVTNKSMKEFARGQKYGEVYIKNVIIAAVQRL